MGGRVNCWSVLERETYGFVQGTCATCVRLTTLCHVNSIHLLCVERLRGMCGTLLSAFCALELATHKIGAPLVANPGNWDYWLMMCRDKVVKIDKQKIGGLLRKTSGWER